MHKQYETLGLKLTGMARMDFDHYDPQKLPKLPPEKDKIWYSKFYYKGRSEIDPVMATAVAPDNPMDPTWAILPGEFDRLMEPGHIPGDLGYCLLPNGAGYGATCCELPEVSLEMYKWYKKLRMVEQLSYQIWYPGSHLSEINGVTEEDVGFGLERFDLAGGATFQNQGFTCNPKEKDPDFVAIIGGNSWVKNLDHPDVKPRALMILHYIRKRPAGGIEFRTHLYIGMHCVNGKPVVRQLIEPELCLEITRRMAHHCAYERYNLNSFLPELYQRMKNEDIPEPEDTKGALPLEEC